MYQIQEKFHVLFLLKLYSPKNVEKLKISIL